MKNQIKLLFWALALAFYSAPKAVAQGYQDPLEDTVYVNEESDTNILNHLKFFSLLIKGSETSDITKAQRLKSVSVKTSSSITGLTKNENPLDNFEIAYETPFDTTSWYGAFDENNAQIVLMNKTLSKTFRNLNIYGPLKIQNLVPGEVVSVEVILEIGLDGQKSEFFYPKKQYIAYKTETLSVKQTSKQKIDVYPNPFVNKINVNFPQGKNTLITITNSVGQVFYKGNPGEIYTENFPSGMYFVHTAYGNFPVVKN